MTNYNITHLNRLVDGSLQSLSETCKTGRRVDDGTLLVHGEVGGPPGPHLRAPACKQEYWQYCKSLIDNCSMWQKHWIFLPWVTLFRTRGMIFAARWPGGIWIDLLLTILICKKSMWLSKRFAKTNLQCGDHEENQAILRSRQYRQHQKPQLENDRARAWTDLLPPSSSCRSK